MTRRRAKPEQAPDAEELALLLGGDLDQLEALGWDWVVRRLIVADVIPRPPGEERDYSYIDYLALTRERSKR
jgi:hypothetical protein